MRIARMPSVTAMAPDGSAWPATSVRSIVVGASEPAAVMSTIATTSAAALVRSSSRR